MRVAILFALLALPASVAAQVIPGKAPMTRDELSQARGGFRLPGGLDVNLGITTETLVNGNLVLRSVYTLADGRADLRVLGPGADGAGPNGGPGGTISVQPNGVRFSGEDLDVRHLVGNAFGTVLSNSGNDRTIDLSSTLDIQVSGVTPAMLGSSALRVEGLALDATSRLAR